MSRLACLLALFVLPALWNSVALTAEKPAHSFYAADSSKKLLAKVDQEGKLVWRYAIGPLHDLHQLPGGNLLFQTSWTRLVELDPATKRIVWEYDAKDDNDENLKVEIHAFQRLQDGNTMVAESGRGRIIEVDQSGKIQREILLEIDKPHPHHDTRLARKLPSGHYLVCHENDGTVREYDSSGHVVWEYEVPLFGKPPKKGHGLDAFGNQCFSALRLKNGNTLIGTGNGHSVIEVTPAKKIVWSVHQDELPGIRLAWVTTLQVLKNGNIVIGNCHAGPENPQLIEITREKKVVWTYKNHTDFGNALTNSVILESP